MYYQIPALELSLSVPLVLLLQAVFRRAGARVWFMTSCCCLVEFGSSCFNHASIESWFVWFGPWYTTHSISIRARGKRSRISIYSAARYMLSTLFFFLSQDLVKRLYHIYVTWFDRFLHREGDNVLHSNKWSFMFNRLPNSKTKLKLKHLWDQGGPLVFWGPYSACVFCV